MPKVGKVHSDYLRKTRESFENIQKNTEIAAVLSNFSYGETRIQEGLALHGTAESVFRDLLQARQSKLAAGQNVRQRHSRLHTVYMGHVTRLRKELAGDPVNLKELGLVGRRGDTIAKFIEEATNLYSTGLNKPEVAAVILPFGFTPELLQSGLDDLQAYQTLRSSYRMLTGECQKLLVEREKAFKALRRWMSALIATCRVAFADNLQTMEEIGFFVRSGPRPKDGTQQPEPPPGTEPPADPGAEPVDPGADPGGTGSNP